MIEELNKLKESIKSAAPTMQKGVATDLHQQVVSIIELAKRKDKVNNLYGLYFDKTYGDGLSAEEAATDLGLA